MLTRELKNYSLSRAIREMTREGTVRTGLEAEVSQEIEREMPQRSSGTFIPIACLGTGRRDLTVGNFGSGGAMVGVTMADQVIEVLRNETTILRLGARVMAGLKGTVALPRQTSTSNIQTVGETQGLATSSPTVDQLTLTPKRIGCFVDVSRQLILESNIDVEAWLRREILDSFAVKLDKLILEGQGGTDGILGLANVNGIGSMSFVSAPVWQDFLNMEKSLALANALRGKPAFILTPAVAAVLKATPKVAASAFPIFILEDADWRDETNDGKISGYRAAVTNQLSNNRVMYGDFQQAQVCFWGSGALEVVSNPYTLDTQGMIRLTLNCYCDAVLRHPQSICISADAGNIGS
jgi:HK97 family phage major capsid protein